MVDNGGCECDFCEMALRAGFRRVKEIQYVGGKENIRLEGLGALYNTEFATFQFDNPVLENK